MNDKRGAAALGSSREVCRKLRRRKKLQAQKAGDDKRTTLVPHQGIHRICDFGLGYWYADIKKAPAFHIVNFLSLIV